MPFFPGFWLTADYASAHTFPFLKAMARFGGSKEASVITKTGVRKNLATGCLKTGGAGIVRLISDGEDTNV